MKATVATLLLVVAASLWLLSPTGKATNANSPTKAAPAGLSRPDLASPTAAGQGSEKVKTGLRQGAGNIEVEHKPDWAGVRLNGNGYIEVFGNVDNIRSYPAEIRLYDQPRNAATITLNGQTSTIKAKNVQSGDLIFEKGGTPLWRMYEDEDGLYVESLKTGKHYQFTLKPVAR